MNGLEQAFQRFHAANPEVYDLFDKFAQEVRQAGHKRYSADAVFHRIRWYTDVETKDEAPFKLNNNYTPYYARLWQKNNPNPPGFFRTRRVK